MHLAICSSAAAALLLAMSITGAAGAPVAGKPPSPLRSETSFEQRDVATLQSRHLRMLMPSENEVDESAAAATASESASDEAILLSRRGDLREVVKEKYLPYLGMLITDGPAETARAAFWDNLQDKIGKIGDGTFTIGDAGDLIFGAFPALLDAIFGSKKPQSAPAPIRTPSPNFQVMGRLKNGTAPVLTKLPVIFAGGDE